MKRSLLILLALSATTLSGSLSAQEASKKTDAAKAETPVSRAEYDKLKQELDTLKAQMQQVLAAKAQAPAAAAPAPAGGRGKAVVEVSAPAIDTALEERLTALEESSDYISPGSTNFLLTGFAFAGFNNLSNEDSSFNASFNPIFLWKMSDEILFEGELELSVEDNETEVGLEYAQISYIVSDYITIGVGKFLNPSNYFSERLHPAWINKFASAPLPFGHGGLMAGTQLGIQARGGLPIGTTRLTYAAYLSNGPSLNVEGEGGDHSPEAGSLDFNNFSDLNNNKAVGGRIGFKPIPSLDIGYGFEFASVAPSGSAFRNVDAVTQSIDANYVKNSSLLMGVIDARAQLVWLDIDNPGISPLDFGNGSRGGYGQLAYRPMEIDNNFIKSLEPVARYDWVNRPGDSKIDRMSFGINYWINASTALKASYEFGNEREGGESTDFTGVRVQAAIGF
ncbi:MAG: hypothetical protein QM496_15385 [Verrucomicrobiota bacterium]